MSSQDLGKSFGRSPIPSDNTLAIAIFAAVNPRLLFLCFERDNPAFSPRICSWDLYGELVSIHLWHFLMLCMSDSDSSGIQQSLS